MILAFDTSSAACTAALFDGAGECIARKDEMIGRGHSERLVPMIAELLEGRSADRILVGVGPGSFTGIRVAIAAATASRSAGVPSFAACRRSPCWPRARNRGGGRGGGARRPWRAVRPAVRRHDGRAAIRAAQSRPARRGADCDRIAGRRVGRRAAGRCSRLGRSARSLAVGRRCTEASPALRTLPAKPVYARAPDARVKEAA